MTLYIAGPSALEYWRNNPFGSRRQSRAVLPFGNADVSEPEFKVSDLAALETAGLSWLSEPVHLLVPAASSRRRCAKAVFHVCSASIPAGSFERVSREVLVASPELACAMAAPMLDFPFFVELLYEFCGWYRLPNGRRGGFVERPPATSVSNLGAFAKKARGVYGANALQKALRYVCDNSFSPVETDVAEIMVFDPRKGGFGVEKPLMNQRFEVAGKDRRALPQSAFAPDLHWPRARISIEYDSDLHHRSERDISRDAIRRNGIEQLGTRVITLTWAQAANYYEFERVATMVSDALGKRRSERWSAWEQRRRELHRLLLSR